MATIPEQFLFCWDSVAQLGDLERLQLVLDALPDEPLMQLLEAPSGGALHVFRAAATDTSFPYTGPSSGTYTANAQIPLPHNT